MALTINLGLSAVATGTSDVITATYSPAPTLADKKVLFLRITNPNTTQSPTFNPNSLGAKPILTRAGDSINVGDLVGVVILMYDLAEDCWILLNPQSVLQISNDQLDAILNSNSPSSSNPFATTFDLAVPSLRQVLTAGNATVDKDIVVTSGTNVRLSGQTASKIAVLDSSKNLVSGSYSESDFCQTTDSRLSDTRLAKVSVYNNVTSSSVTGTTSETYIQGLLMPSLNANSATLIAGQVGKTGTAGNVNFKIYYNTTNDISGSPVLIATVQLGATSLWGGFRRVIVNKNSLTSNEVFAPNVTGFTDDATGTTAPTALNVDLSGKYIVITATNGNSGDSTFVRNWRIQIQNP